MNVKNKVTLYMSDYFILFKHILLMWRYTKKGNTAPWNMTALSENIISVLQHSGVLHTKSINVQVYKLLWRANWKQKQYRTPPVAASV